jgi:class 3 adenylate cyclase
MTSEQASYPLPDDPLLADMARAMRDDGAWGEVFDTEWNLAYVTDEARRTFGGGELAEFPMGHPRFGPESVAAALGWRFGPNTREGQRADFALLGGFMLADVPGGREALRELVDPIFHDMIDDLEPRHELLYAGGVTGSGLTHPTGVKGLVIRIRDESGRLVGTAVWAKPALGMDMIAALLSNADFDHLHRMHVVAKAARRPAAVLFADVEGSTPLSRRLSTASYFSLARRLVRASDRCVIEAGGLVGRHVGDGVVAFFLAETCGSESAAARSCIEAMRSLRAAISDVAAASDLHPDDLTLRFGLHWGSTLYVGGITTSGRSEVTALGDEANEAARIEACATGGRTLASKTLIERLEGDDAAALGIDPDRMSYSILGELSTASEKARRDAPAIAVCEL